MLTIVVPDRELFDSRTNTFTTITGCELQLEHSLISISKWESKWHVPFLDDGKRSKQKKTNEMLVDYIRCMTVNSKSVPDDRIYNCLSKENMEAINAYINDPMTATTFSNHDKDQKRAQNSGSFVTAEIIYYQMIELGIPVELWEKRHLNRLMTLIRVVSEKKAQANNPKKMSQSDIAKQNRALHAARRKPRAH